MIKELVISIAVIVVIFSGNYITEAYTKKCVDTTCNTLLELREEVVKEEEKINVEYVKEKIDKIHDDWDKMYQKLSFYIEHNELEKVETEITTLKSYAEKKEYVEVLPEIDKTIFILNHIKDKTKIYLKNIF